MIKKITIIGGDLRIVKLVEMLAEDKFEIKTYAMEKADSISKLKNVEICETLKEAIKDTDIVISSIPLSSNNTDINIAFSEKNVKLEELANELEGKTFIAGNIKNEFKLLIKNKNVRVIDLLEREELVVLNAISTAEGAIQIAMEETKITIHGSKILVLGFGRIGKVLSKMLNGIGAEVYCEARRDADLAWIKAYGYKPVILNELNESLEKFDIIINTIPSIVLEEDRLKLLKNDCLIIDLASNPGGVDRNAAQNLGIKTIWALALPGKVAPITSAEFIKNTIYNTFKEL